MGCLAEQTETVEVIVVHEEDPPDISPPIEGRFIPCAGTTRAVLLNAGAAAAGGDVLLFLWPDTQLPPDAPTAIERNFQLLPQTIGGNFHLKFDDASPFAKLLTRFLKHWRYQGRYYGNSGIFVRRDVFEALGGFQPYPILEDYDFARRMEKDGPTLYLPETVVTSARKFKNHKLKASIVWLLAHILFSFDLHPLWFKGK